MQQQRIESKIEPEGFRSPVNMANTMMLGKFINVVANTMPPPARMSAGKRKYGPVGDRPKVARFRAGAYVNRVLVAEYPSYDSYNRFQDKIKTVIHDEELGLNRKLIPCCEGQIRKRSYDSLVIYANFEPMPATNDHNMYNYMINKLMWKKDRSDCYWKYPWKKLVYVNGTLNKELTLAANPGFNIAGYPDTPALHNQIKLL